MEFQAKIFLNKVWTQVMLPIISTQLDQVRCAQALQNTRISSLSRRTTLRRRALCAGPESPKRSRSSTTQLEAQSFLQMLLLKTEFYSKRHQVVQLSTCRQPQQQNQKAARTWWAKEDPEAADPKRCFTSQKVVVLVAAISRTASSLSRANQELIQRMDTHRVETCLILRPIS